MHFNNVTETPKGTRVLDPSFPTAQPCHSVLEAERRLTEPRQTPTPQTYLQKKGQRSSRLVEGASLERPNHLQTQGLLRIPRLSMAKPHRLPLCHVNEGAEGQGLQGECCSCSTMQPVSGRKSACHYKFSSLGGITDFGTQSRAPGTRRAAAAASDARKQRWAGMAASAALPG